MPFGPSTPNTELADELESLVARLRENPGIFDGELDALDEAVTRIRELGDEEDL